MRPTDPDKPSAEPRTLWQRIPRPVKRLAVIVAVIVVLRRSGAIDFVSDEDRLQAFVDSAGIFGPILYALLFTLLVPVGVPGLVFVVPAAAIFSTPVAIAVSLVGGYLSSGIGVMLARTTAREKLAAKLPAKFRAWDERIAEKGLIAVIALRVITYLAAPADWLLGLSSIPTRTIVVGTVVGLIPPTVGYIVIGGGILDLLA